MLLFCDVCGRRILAVRYTLYRAWEDSEHTFCSLRCLKEWLGKGRRRVDSLEIFGSRGLAPSDYFNGEREGMVGDFRERGSERFGGRGFNRLDWFKKGKAEIVKELSEEELEIVTGVEKALENFVTFDTWAWCAGLHLFDFGCFDGAVELCFDFELQTVTLTYNMDYALGFLSGGTIMEVIECYKGYVNWVEEWHRKLEQRKFKGEFVYGDGRGTFVCVYVKEYGS